MIIKINKTIFKKIKIFVILFFLFFLSAGVVYSYEIDSIKIVGQTVNIDFSNLIKLEKREITEKEIRSLVAKITDKYHKEGFTAAYVKKITVKKDGTLEIHIHETKIFGIDVIGVEDEEKRDAIAKALLPRADEVFNRLRISKRIKKVRKEFSLRSIKIDAEKNENNDVFFLVKVSEKGGSFYAQVGYGMAYGISPLVGYYHPFKKSIIDIYLLAGHKENKFRRLEGNIKYYYFPDNTSFAVYAAINSGRLIDIWETRIIKYEVVSVTPKAGTMYKKDMITGHFYLSQRIMWLNDYPHSGKIYDTGLNIDFDISNREKLLDKMDSSGLKINLSGGWYNHNSTIYFKSDIDGYTSLSPFSLLRLIPKFNISYTSSDDRFFWEYVYDINMIGFFNDYTASKWKNSAGLDIEIEVNPGQFYLGPFINSGYFINEEDKWTFKTGTGIKGRILFNNFNININYAWDITASPSKGGFFFNITGRF